MFLVLSLLCLSMVTSRAQAKTRVQRQADGDLVISGTLEAVPGYPRVHVRLSRDGKVLTAQPQVLGGRLAGMEGLEQMLSQRLDQQNSQGDNAKADPEANGAGNGPGNDVAKHLDRSFTAFLDTGASAFVIGKSTAQRFGIKPQPRAVYHEAGLQGQTPMHVSKAYTVALAGSSGTASRKAGRFRVINRHARLQLVPKPPSNPLVRMSMGAINVIGTPAIRRMVVEIIPPSNAGGGLGGASQLLSGSNGQAKTKNGDAEDAKKEPNEDRKDLQNLNLQDLQNLDLQDLNTDGLLQQLGQLSTGPSVRLHDPAYRPRRTDLSIALKYVDYTRTNNPKDRGPRPALAANPVITDIVTKNAGHQFTGDWLLDTGAPASIISTDQAEALGIYQNGQPIHPADFTIPLGGISGKMSTTPGFVIDRLRLKTRRGHTITYNNAHVLVHDVRVVLDGGEKVTLDGVFGTNFLLPTVAGLGSGLGLPSQSADGAYDRIWIDGPRGRLLLSLPTQTSQVRPNQP